jgi:hypothetical protein
VLLLIAVAYVHPFRAYQRAESEVDERKAEIKRLLRENGKLANRLSLSGTEAFIEREARKLGLVRPGERLFIVRGARSEQEPPLP